MAGFGCYNPFPFTFGDFDSYEEQIHGDLMRQYEPVLTPDESKLPETEAYAEAGIIAMIWDAADRAGNQVNPLTMTTALLDWEESCKMVNDSRVSLTRRRANLAAKFLGFGGNSKADIFVVCSQILGSVLVDVTYVTDAEDITYWPGINPGPPGLEWASNRAIAFVEVTPNTATRDEFERRVAECTRQLNNMLPARMSFAFYVWDVDLVGDEGFVLDHSLLDEAAL